jgi:hypothetical protein
MYRTVKPRARVYILRSPGIDSQPGGIDSLGSIPGLLIRLQIRALISKRRIETESKGNYDRVLSELQFLKSLWGLGAKEE